MNILSVAVIPLFVLSTVPLAAQSVWIDDTGGNWSDGTNWLGGVAPVTSNTTALVFGGSASTAYTATNDSPGVFVLNRLTLQSTNAALVTLANGAGAGLQFAGATPTLTQAGNGPVTLSGTTLDLAGTLTLGGAGDGALTLSSQITGGGGLVLNRASPSFLATTTLNSSNSFTGGVTLQSGALSLGALGALGTDMLTVASTGSGFAATGDMRASTAVTWSNAITFNPGATLNVLTGSTITFSSAVSGGGLNVGTAVTAGSVTLTASSAPTAVTVPGGTLTLSGAGTITTGGLTLPLGRGATLALDNSTANVTNRLAPTTTLNLARSTFNLTANATAGNPAAQSLAAMQGVGQSAIRVNASAANPATLTMGELSRASRGTFTVGFTATGTGMGTAAPGTAGVSNILLTTLNGAAPTAALVGAGGGAGTTTRSIIPFITTDTTTSASGNTFATYDATTGLRPLDLTTEYAALSQGQHGNTATTNTRATASVPGLSSAVTVNSLVLSGASANGFGTQNVALNVTSGAVLLAGTAPAIATRTLNFGAAEALIFQSASAASIFSQITGSGGLTYSGGSGTTDNNLQLFNTANSFTGTITLNAGRLTARGDGALGAAANSIVLNGGMLDFQGTDITTTRAISVGAAGGSIVSIPLGNSITGGGQRLTLAGDITGSGLLRLNGNFTGGVAGFATIVLSGNNAGYTGQMAIDSGSVQVDSDARLGSGGRLLLSGGTLQATASFATSKVIDMDASSTLRVDAGHTLTLNGRVNALSTGTNLTKTGPGTLTLTSPATHTGATTLGVTTGSSQNYGGDFILSGGGQLTSTGVSILGGGRLILANGTTNSDNRLASTPLTLTDGTLRLEGNAASPTAESLGILTTSANGLAAIDVAPAGAQTSTLAFSNAAGSAYSPNATSTAIFSGTGLSSVTGQSRIQFIAPTAPVLTNGILPRAFGVDGGSAGLVTTEAVVGGVGVRLLTAGEYTTAFAGAPAGANVRISAPETVAANQTVNAAVLSGTTLTINAGATLGLAAESLLLTPGSSVTGAGALSGGSTFLSIHTSGTAASTSSIAVPLTSNTVSKSGAGSLTLSGTGSAFTTLNVLQGTIAVGAAGAIPAGAAVNLSAPATLDLNSNSTAFNSLNGLGTVQVGSNPATVLTLGGSINSAFGGAILGSGSITKTGTGTLRFTETAQVTQAITLTGGTLTFGSSSGSNSGLPLVSGGDIAMADGTAVQIVPVSLFTRNITINTGASVGTGNVTFGGGFGTTTELAGNFLVGTDKTLNINTTLSGLGLLSGVISGPGSVTLTSVTNLALQSANTYLGPTTVSSTGIISVGNAAAFGNGGAVSFTGGTNALATYNGSHTVANPVHFGGNTSLTGSHDLTFNGATTLGTQAGTTRTFTINGSGTLGLTAVANGTTATALIKAGNGSLSLAGNNTFSGGLAVNAGSVVLLPGSQLSGSGAVSVGSAERAVLGGSGSITGLVTITANGLLSPGVDTSTAGSLSLAGPLDVRGAMRFDLFSGAGLGDNTANLSASDLLILPNTVTINAGALLLIDNPNNLSAFAPGDKWRLWNASGAVTGDFGAPNIFAPALSGGMLWDFNSSTGVLAIVPEPSGAVLLLGGLLGTVLRRRRLI